MLSTNDMCEYLFNINNIPILLYDNKQTCIARYTNKEYQHNYCTFLNQNLFEKANINFPVLYFEFNCIIYGIIKSLDGYYILGPCVTIPNSKLYFKEISLKYNIDDNITYCSMKKFATICSMLFEQCNDIKITYNEIITLNVHNNIITENIEKEIDNTVFSYQEQCKTHNPYDQERREQNSIKNGDLESLKRSFNEKYSGEVGILAKNTLRSAQNIAITIIALASRSAIEGGIPSETVYSISDSYVLQIEEASQPTEAISLARQAEIYYTKLVNDHLNNLDKNSLIARCKIKIHQNICQKIRVSDLANELGVNPNYLSEKFNKEEGISLVSYINREKIHFAKEKLRYSNDDYGLISYLLGFSSQSHFINVFKKFTGMTPKKYRDKYR